MGIKIEGLDEMKKTIGNLVKDIGTDIVKIANDIVNEAKEICNDPNCERIILKNIGYDEIEKTFKMDLEFKDKGAIDCVIKAIQNKLDSKFGQSQNFLWIPVLLPVQQGNTH